jgi:predicted O-methyltransferase YrrM
MNPVIKYLWGLDSDLKRKDCGIDALTILNDTAFALRNEKRGPLLILEIGTFNAYSALVFAQYGVVHTLDICAQPNTQAVIDMFPCIRENVIRHIGYNQDELRPCIRTLAPFDIIFVDGGHGRYAVEKDMAFVEDMGDLIFCHDYRPVFPDTVAVTDEFVARGGWKFTAFDEEKTLGLCLLERTLNEQDLQT